MLGASLTQIDLCNDRKTVVVLFCLYIMRVQATLHVLFHQHIFVGTWARKKSATPRGCTLQGNGISDSAINTCTERDRLPQDAVCQKFDKFDNFRLRVTNALSRNCDNCPNPDTNLTPNPIFSLLLLQPFAFRNQKYRPTTKTTLKFQDVSDFLSLIGQ